MLSFKGPQADLEELFREGHYRQDRKHFRLVYLVAVFLIGTWALIDLRYYPEHLGVFLKLKFLFLSPLLLGLFLFSFHPAFGRMVQVVNMVTVVVVGATFNAMILLASSPVVYPIIYGLTITTVINYTFIKARLLPAAVAGWLLYALTFATLLRPQLDMSFLGTAANLYYLLVLNVLGMVINVALERRSRQEFLLRHEMSRQRDNLQETNRRLEESLAEVNTLRGILPICASCKKIRNEDGYWQQVEEYLGDHTDARFTHGICQECRNRVMAEMMARSRPDNQTPDT